MYGATEIKQSTLQATIIDSGSSQIILETTDYYNFVDMLKADSSDFDCTGANGCVSAKPCDELIDKL